jgi:LysM repeat protein
MKNKFKAYTIALAMACCFTATIQGQSSKLLTSKDSVFMFVHEGGQKILMHPVKKGQTLYGISKFYSITQEELVAFNPWYKDDKTIETKDKVLVPLPNKAIHRYVKSAQTKNYAPLYYVVQKGDNLFNISKRYFEMPVADLVKRNNLKSETIELGQLLHVGWVPVTGIPKEWRSGSTTPTATPAPTTTTKGSPAVVLPTHAAYWVKDKDSVSGNFCLTNLAPKNSVIIVTNPVTKKSIEVNVVGKLNIIKNKKIKIILSETAAQTLGLNEKDYLVNIVPKK